MVVTGGVCVKIILSRKGFDSTYGGYPSIIYKNGYMQSFPIPNLLDSIRYSDIYCKAANDSLYNVMKAIRSKIHSKTWIDLSEESTCHLDPDIDFFSIPRKEGWVGCFGQGAASQSVLKNSLVGEGDIFLFFGWFNIIRLEELGRLEFENSSGIHAIYGYLQVDKVIYTANDEIPSWLQYHSHVNKRHLDKPNNCIYIAKDFCTWNKKRRGYGVFNYTEELRLTKEGLSRSKWCLPDIFKNVNITYHSKDSWKDGYFQAAHRGQEFVVDATVAIQNWAIELIERNARE